MFYCLGRSGTSTALADRKSCMPMGNVLNEQAEVMLL